MSRRAGDGYGDYSTIEGAAISGSVHLIGALGWLMGHDSGGGPDTDTTIGGNLYLGPAFSAYMPSTHVVIKGYILTAWNSQILYPNGDVFAEFSVGQVCAEHWTRDGTPPVADGTYTVGKGAATDGTITIEDGIITAVQEATN